MMQPQRYFRHSTSILFSWCVCVCVEGQSMSECPLEGIIIIIISSSSSSSSSSSISSSSN
jgi:hypothetical protein